MEEEPVTPITGPILDLDGQLTYLGEDGQRYVVLDNLRLDQEASQRVADLLEQRANGVHQRGVEVRALVHDVPALPDTAQFLHDLGSNLKDRVGHRHLGCLRGRIMTRRGEGSRSACLPAYYIFQACFAKCAQHSVKKYRNL